jgi:serine/threonine protein kinase
MAFPTRYKVMDTGAAGGFGRVLRARDSWLERDVAVKVLDPLMALDERNRSGFSKRQGYSPAYLTRTFPQSTT